MKKLSLLLAVMVIAAMFITSCAPAATPAPAPTAAPAQPAEPTQAPEPTEAPTAAPAPTNTPIPPKCEPLPNQVSVNAGDLGSPENPIVIGFVPSGETGRITRAGNEIADCLSQMTGLSFEIEVGTSFAATIEAMGANKAQVGFLNTFSELLAEAKYGIIPGLAVLRKYNTNPVDPDKDLAGQLEPFYKGQFIANKASGIQTLQDLKGKTFCFVDPNSTSGSIIPRIILQANGIDPEKDFAGVQNAGSHDNVGIAVYKGDCDAGVSYIDVLTDAGANLQEKYPDILDKVTYIAVTDRIPSDGVQFVKELDPAIRASITDGLLAMAEDPGGNQVLRLLYTINGFEKIDATFYQPFAEVLKKAGVDPATLVK